MTSQELTHPYLVHPRTGEPLQAIAVHPLTGRPVWPIMGGDGTESDANDDTGNEDDDTQDGAGDEGQDDEHDNDAGEDARVKRANKQAAKYRADLRETQKQLAAATAVLDKLKGAFGGDDSDDPEAKINQATERVATLEAERNALATELLVTRLAPKHKADAAALLDSRSFTKTLAGLDPSDDDYDDQVAEAIKDAVKKNANLAATGQAPAGGASGAGQGSAKGAGAVTQEQFNAMTLGQRNDLFKTNPDLYRRLAAAIR